MTSCVDVVAVPTYCEGVVGPKVCVGIGREKGTGKVRFAGERVVRVLN